MFFRANIHKFYFYRNLREKLKNSNDEKLKIYNKIDFFKDLLFILKIKIY